MPVTLPRTSAAQFHVAEPLLPELVAQSLATSAAHLQAEFARPVAAVPVRYCVLDNVLPEHLARQIAASFPPLSEMRLMSSFREQKYTSKRLSDMHPLVRQALLAFQSPDVLKVVESITGMAGLMADPSFYAGGLSAMTQGHFLQPHLDNSHNESRTHYRRLNLLYYVSPDWQVEHGGNLELWDGRVRERIEIPSLFNRLVIMETNRRSWHSVNVVRESGMRRCVSNYYFSTASPESEDYFNVTTFAARPEQPVRRLLSKVDNFARSALRIWRGQTPRQAR